MKNNNLIYVVPKGMFTYHSIKHNFSFRSNNFYINFWFSVWHCLIHRQKSKTITINRLVLSALEFYKELKNTRLLSKS